VHAAHLSTHSFRVLPVSRRFDADRAARARALRVALLVVVCVLISLADLEMTLLFTQSVGMVELNPIARLVMATDNPLAVIAFKVVTMSFGLGTLYWHRRRPYAEYGAWVCFLTLVWLSARWFSFTHIVENYTPEHFEHMAAADHRFVIMSP
jgi:hypothetical protein